jgi:hypothetical protein
LSLENRISLLILNMHFLGSRDAMAGWKVLTAVIDSPTKEIHSLRNVSYSFLWASNQSLLLFFASCVRKERSGLKSIVGNYLISQSYTNDYFCRCAVDKVDWVENVNRVNGLVLKPQTAVKLRYKTRLNESFPKNKPYEPITLSTN